MKKYDVAAVCNALVDILVEVPDADIQALGLTKGIMHLVDNARQKVVLDHVATRPHMIELGGSAMNATRTVASLGLKTVFAGMVGRDDFGRRIQERMHQLRITARLGETSEPTGSCVILITPDGERTMNTHLGASRLYDSSHIPVDDITHAKLVHFCGYQWDTDGQKAAITKTIAAAKQASTLVSFDLADPFVVTRYRAEFQRIIRDDADIVFANKEEARLMYESDPEDCARIIADSGAIAVIKLGGDGALVRKGNESFRIPVFPTTVVDTTAAGDMFAAGFLYGFSKGADPKSAARIGAFLASDVISRVGATVSEAALAEAPQLLSGA